MKSIRANALLTVAPVGAALTVFGAACGNGSAAGSSSMQSGSSGGGGSSGTGSSSGDKSSSGSGASSSGGSESSSGSSSSLGSGDGGTLSGGSIPPGIPTTGTCTTIPAIVGDPMVGTLLAIASHSKCSGSNVVSSHSYSKEGGSGGSANICKLNGAVYFESGMNIDCDGLADSCMPQHCPSNDPTYQAQTSFVDARGMYLYAGLTPYVVIPNDFNYPGLDMNRGGSVIAVIYKNQLEFAVFGDTGPQNIIGEASYATANNLGINPDPANGGTPGPVTYIVFTGSGTAPQDLSNPLQTWQLGTTLAQQLISNNP